MSRTDEILWEASPAFREASGQATLMRWLAAHRGLQLRTYDELWQWSVDHLEEFHEVLWEYFDIAHSGTYDEVLGSRRMPGAEWFAGTRVNYAEHALRHRDLATPALVAVHEGGEPVGVSWDELSAQVGALTASLRRLGVGRGDAVAGYLPNIAEAVVAFLATASLGAVWACCSPDFGPLSVVERFRQVAPKVLFVADGSRYGGKLIDCSPAVVAIAAQLPSVEHIVWVPNVGGASPPAALTQPVTPWADLVSEPAPLEFTRVDFNAPLWVLFSSGTTGPPKGIIHSHGGIILEYLKSLALHMNLKPGDRFFWFTTTSWTMWNILVGGLLLGATPVLYEGSPIWPDRAAQWRLAEQCRITLLGTSAAYLIGCQNEGVTPGKSFDLSSVVSVGSTGSTLPATTFRWVYEAVKPDVWLVSSSGGTDVSGGFVGGSPLLPVRAGEIQARCLGVAVAAWNEEGKPVVDEVGELVVTAPMPSMPIRFLDDADGAKYHDAYFSMFPGVWRHGDWMTLLSSGAVMIHGRSDSTINRMGVRMGSAEIYAVVEAMPEVAEALVLGIELPDGGYSMPLFVALREGQVLDEALAGRIRTAIRTLASPRHVPDEIIAVPGIPHTLTGKKLEVPIKRMFQGVPLGVAVNLGAVDSPALVEHFAALAASAGSSR